MLDIARGNIKLKKCTFQNRARKTIVLLRLDWDGPNHQNPDGEWIVSPHIHIYREGFGDKWAYPLPPDSFTNVSDPQLLLDEFMCY